MRTAIFVVGMHRSGTSALARTLNLLGAGMPRRLLPPGIGNEAGHWEPEASVRLHDRLLEAAGTSVNDVSGPPEHWFQAEAAEAFLSEMKELIVSEFAEKPLFVFKDPRSALVFPLWRRVLSDLDIRCLPVIISRNPVEVAQSLAKRRIDVMSDQAWPLDRGGLLWLRYVLAAERYTRGTTRSFCLYADLVRDWRTVVRQVAGDLDLSWPRPLEEAEADIDGFLSPHLRHHDEADDLPTRPGIWSFWISPTYEALRHASADPQLDLIELDAIGREFDKACGGVRPAAARPDLPGPAQRRSVTTLPRSDEAIRQHVCLVATVSLLSDATAAQLAGLAEAARIRGADLTIVFASESTSSADGLLNALTAEHGCHVEVCAPGEAAIEPLHMRTTIQLFRYLRTRRFDMILFEDREALGHASVVAKQAGLAFEETVLAGLAFGCSRYWRERNGQFPGTPVVIAMEYLEQQAIERADLCVVASPQYAEWMRERGWRLGRTVPLQGAPAGSPIGGGGWAGVLEQLQPGERASPVSEMLADDVTIVIPHFEQPRLTDLNLQSLTRQSAENFAVIIVDDGSRSVESSDFLASVAGRYPELNIRVLRQDNRYVGAARNAGIRAASTDFIILLDDDNVAYPTMVEVLRRAIHLTKSDVVTCGITPFYDATGTPSLEDDQKGPDHFYPGGPVLLGAMDNCFGDVSGIYRKKVFDEVGYFHELPGVTFEDWQLHLRTVTAGFKLMSLPEPLVWYRVRSGSMLRSTRRYDNARVIASTINELSCSALDPLSDYLMGSEAEQVRLNHEIARVTASAQADVQTTHAVATVNSIALLEAKTEADRHARNLEEALDHRTKSAIEAERYARSLEETVSELRKALDVATRDAGSLERSRTEADASSGPSERAKGQGKHALFIHIPKTGGTSIESMIQRQDGPVSPGPAYFIENTDWNNLQTYKYFFAHAPLFVRDILPDPIVTFTFLRDPVDRVISTYNHLLRTPSAPGAQVLIENQISCVDALTHPALSTHFVDVATRMLGAHLDLAVAQPDVSAMQLASVAAFETEADEFTYRRALDRLGTMQFVGFTERLRQDGRALAELLGLEDGDVPYENQSPIAFDWPMPKAIRTPELEQAVQRNSFFDCWLDKAARDFFLHEDASTRAPAREHFAKLARSDQSVIFANAPQVAEQPRPRRNARRTRPPGSSRLIATERLAGHLEQELRRTHERAAAEISLREAAFKEVERYAKSLEAEIERLHTA